MSSDMIYGEQMEGVGPAGAGHWQQIQVKGEESGSDDEGTERSRAAPGCQIMTRVAQVM